jgi:phage host-nuclease inhibitor protein Gam
MHTLEQTNTEREAFHITDERAANWYLKRLAEIEAEKQRIQAQTDKMIKELEADAAGLRFLYEAELQEWVRQELKRKGSRRKSLHLHQGTCAFRTVPASVKVADPTAAFDYAKRHFMDCIVTTERLDLDAYKKAAGEELLPGMEIASERETFKVTFGTKEPARASEADSDPA